MKTFFAFAVILLCVLSCSFLGEKIQGNGKPGSETRKANNASKISSLGSIDVVVEQGTTVSVKVEADENILPYILVEEQGGWLQIKTKDNTNIDSKSPVKVIITTPHLSALKVSGSGSIVCNNHFDSDDEMNMEIKGSGNITADISSPGVKASIMGSGNIQVKGETKKVEIEIKGSGNYKGDDLKAENADVDIAGSGDATVFADVSLTASIKGSGNIKYRGNATVKKSTAGSGEIVKLQ